MSVTHSGMGLNALDQGSHRGFDARPYQMLGFAGALGRRLRRYVAREDGVPFGLEVGYWRQVGGN